MYSSPLAIASCLFAAIASKCPVSRFDIRVSYGNNCSGFFCFPNTLRLIVLSL